MNVIHLTASRFHGGPERQMLGLAVALPPGYHSAFASFSEGGRCQPFLDMARAEGCKTFALKRDTPRLLAARAELAGLLEQQRADVLCCHGYKANLVGRLAARRVGVPVIAVARGWTADCFRVRCYEALDRLNLRWMDHVVCVSEAQAARVLAVGVPAKRVTVIPNAINCDRFEGADPTFLDQLQDLFPVPRTRIVGAAGRLSPEKGFSVLIEAAERVVAADPSIGFVLFGEGPLREQLQQQIADAELEANFVLAGFRADLDRFIPLLDLLVLPSYTEGLPNVVLEAFAARVPVVATAVGGTPEVVEDGASGFLVLPGDAGQLAERIDDALKSEERRREMGLQGRARVKRDFTFAAQARRYQELFHRLAPSTVPAAMHDSADLCESIR